MDQPDASKQVVSKQRVADHGEVYTNPREVNAMLDLVKQETERIDSRFLEPACGTGNFLTEILRRKLAVVEARYRRSQLEYERYAVLTVSSIYGIDILEDNVVECRRRLFDLFDAEYTRLFKGDGSRSTRTLDESLGWDEAAFKAFVRLLAGSVAHLSALTRVYNDHAPRYKELVERIERTDWLIDQIVYKLYGLTEEEIAIVEGRG